MKNIYTFLILIFLTFRSIFSQTFNVSEVDLSEYPYVKANFSLFNHKNEPYYNLTPNDFHIVDNGYTVLPQFVSIECTNDLPYNVVIVVDRSSSMSEVVDGESKWAWAMAALNVFIDNIPMTFNSQVAITTFAGRADILCPFTDSKTQLKESIKKMPEIFGTTNYNVAFLDDVAGAITLLKNTNPNYKRAIVFLSDGLHNSQTQPLYQHDIIKKLNEYNIQVFAASVLTETNDDLSNFSRQTGGYYSLVATKQQLLDLYLNFTKLLQEKQQCIIKWLSPDICDYYEIYRQAILTFNLHNLRVIKDYEVPKTSIVNIETDQPFYNFGNPDLDSTTEVDIIITPKNRNINVKDIRIVPSAFFEILDWGFGNGYEPNYDFVIPQDKPHKMRVKFKPKDYKKLRKASILIEGTPCPKDIGLIGGYQDIKILRPTENEAISHCDSFDIVWTGNEPTTLLDLYYSIDNGVKWNLIKSRITGYRYKWKSPYDSAYFKFKIESTPGFEYEFVKSFGGAREDSVKSIFASDDGLFFYTCGYFVDSTQIGKYKFHSKGKRDFFVVKYDNEGKIIWATSDGSIYDDVANSIVVDYYGDVYITGQTYKGVSFQNFEPKLENDTLPYLYIAKYSSKGEFINAVTLGADTKNYDFTASGLKLAYEYPYGGHPKLYLEGIYSGRFEDNYYNALLPYRVNEPFSLSFFPNLEIEYVYTGLKYPNKIYSSLKAIYQDSMVVYNTNSYYYKHTIDKIDVFSNGLSDFWISKYAKLPYSFDTSANINFVRQNPSFVDKTFTFGETIVGDSTEATLIKKLYNPYKVPVLITGYRFYSLIDSTMADDFSLLNDITNQIINPKDSIDLIIKFKPTKSRSSSVILEVTSSCSTPITMGILGSSFCGGQAMVEKDFGKANVNVVKSETIPCIFKNISNVDIMISPYIQGTDLKDFKLEIPDTYQKVNGKIVLAPNECLDLIVHFTPIKTGLRKAVINYDVSLPCKSALTQLIGTGIASDIYSDSYNWGRKRINKSYNAQININNLSDIDEKIDSIRFVDPNANKSFTIDMQPSDFPFTVFKNSSYSISVNYLPLVDIYESAEIEIYVNSKNEPLISKLEGTGYLPIMELVWDCGGNIKEGDTSIANLIISNISKSSVLSIESIDLMIDNGIFDWVNINDTQPRVIDTMQTVSIPIRYTPKSNIVSVNTIRIMADDYDGNYIEQWKETNFDIFCGAFKMQYDSLLDFSNRLVCSNNEMTFEITNLSDNMDLDLHLSQAEFEGDAVFELKNKEDLILNRNSTLNITVLFDPKNLGNYLGKLRIPNSLNLPIIIDLMGNSNKYDMMTLDQNITIDVQQEYAYPIEIQIPELVNEVSELTLRLKFNPNVVYLKENSLLNNIQNWTWEKPKNLFNGEYEIKGQGILNPNQKVKLFDVVFVGLLNDYQSTDINITTDLDCQKYNYILTPIKVNQVCMNETRLITLTGSKFFINEISPNPASINTKIKYGVGFDVATKIDVFSTDGKLITNLVDNYQKSGDYEIILNTNELENGVYYIKYVAGPYISIKKLLIIK